MHCRRQQVQQAAVAAAELVCEESEEVRMVGWLLATGCWPLASCWCHSCGSSKQRLLSLSARPPCVRNPPGHLARARVAQLHHPVKGRRQRLAAVAGKTSKEHSREPKAGERRADGACSFACTRCCASCTRCCVACCVCCCSVRCWRQALVRRQQCKVSIQQRLKRRPPLVGVAVRKPARSIDACGKRALLAWACE